MDSATLQKPATGLASFDLCVVGAGFFGAVIAERAAKELGSRVLVIDQRDHIGGNSFSETDQQTGIEVHKYGSHIFHTSDQKIWDYVRQFSEFNSYIHRVLTLHKGRVFSMPINLSTINDFYGKNFTPVEAEAFIAKEVERDQISFPSNFEERAISQIGRPLYEAFIKGYSEKQWQTDLTLLPAATINRLPVRFNYNTRYFDDRYEGIPLEGYGAIFKKMLSHPNIAVHLKTDFFELKPSLPKGIAVVYSGPIDRYFDYRFGKLGWRTLDFETEHIAQRDFQGTSVMNYADTDVKFTRVHEFRHYHPERSYSADATVIFREYSRHATAKDMPYYPINTEEDKKLLAEYKQAADNEARVVFGGRLASYKYLDMHQVIGAALNSFEREVRPLLMAK